MSTAEFRIEFSIQRADDEKAAFDEIGFGSSGAWSTVDAAMHAAATDVEHRVWETTDGMPDPSKVDS